MSTEFEEFLYALVGEQKNGMPVSTFSALARLDIDPWREAKRLSELPKDGAIQALRGSIDLLTDLQWTKIDAPGIAARLIRLLPNHGGRVRSGSDDESVPRRPQPVTPASLLNKASNLPISVWLAIGAAVFVALYVLWPGDNPSRPQNPAFQPSSYDNPVREPRR